MRWDELEDEDCSIARTVAVIGDRWTILILRNCFSGGTRFDYLQEHLGITRHVLADRLRSLVEEGVLEKIPYQEKPVRYEYLLTQKGLDLFPLMLAMMRWGDGYKSKGEAPPRILRHLTCSSNATPLMVCSECGEVLVPKDVKFWRSGGKIAKKVNEKDGLESSFI